MSFYSNSEWRLGDPVTQKEIDEVIKISRLHYEKYGKYFPGSYITPNDMCAVILSTAVILDLMTVIIEQGTYQRKDVTIELVEDGMKEWAKEDAEAGKPTDYVPESLIELVPPVVVELLNPQS